MRNVVTIAGIAVLAVVATLAPTTLSMAADPDGPALRAGKRSDVRYNAPVAFVPHLFVEASVSRPHDVGFAIRREGVDASIRAQGYRGQFVLGASYARSNPYLSPRFAVGRQAFSGADVRWAHPSGLQARGEILKGHSYEGVSTIGWYLDGFIHRPGWAPSPPLSVENRWTTPRPRRATVAPVA